MLCFPPAHATEMHSHTAHQHWAGTMVSPPLSVLDVVRIKLNVMLLTIFMIPPGHVQIIAGGIHGCPGKTRL